MSGSGNQWAAPGEPRWSSTNDIRRQIERLEDLYTVVLTVLSRTASIP